MVKKKKKALKFDEKYCKQAHDNAGRCQMGGTERALTVIWSSLPFCRFKWGQGGGLDPVKMEFLWFIKGCEP